MVMLQEISGIVPRMLPYYRDNRCDWLAERMEQVISRRGDGRATPQYARYSFQQTVLQTATLYYGTTAFCDLLEDALQACDFSEEGKCYRLPEDSMLRERGFIYLQRPLTPAKLGLDDQLEETDQIYLAGWSYAPVEAIQFMTDGRVGAEYFDHFTSAIVPIWLGDREDRTLGVVGTGSPVLEAIAAILSQPGIVTSTTVSPRPGVIRRATKAGIRPPPDVQVIDLRRSVVKGLADVAHAERTYRHRWIVRGHWRNQTHGPGHELRRRMYIAPHLKGPDGAPLLTGEKVYKW